MTDSEAETLHLAIQHTMLEYRSDSPTFKILKELRNRLDGAMEHR